MTSLFKHSINKIYDVRTKGMLKIIPIEERSDLRNTFHDSEVHRSMNAMGHVQSK